MMTDFSKVNEHSNEAAIFLKNMSKDGILFSVGQQIQYHVLKAASTRAVCFFVNSRRVTVLFVIPIVGVEFVSTKLSCRTSCRSNKYLFIVFAGRTRSN